MVTEQNLNKDLTYGYTEWVKFFIILLDNFFPVPISISSAALDPSVFFKIGGQLPHNAVFVSAAQQSESALCTHVSPLFWSSFPFRSPQSTEQSSLCCIVGSHYSAILYLV